jgi:antitoxin (DNA-binding transcriptional repressor) of toxin-antitoxin stability system/type 1 fimbria pilin
MGIVDTRKANTHLSRLIDEAAKGNSFVIAKAGKPMVKVVALDALSRRQIRRLGFLRGKLSIRDDFNSFGSRKIARLFSLVLILTVLSACGTAAGATPNASPGISLKIAAVQKTVDTGSPVLIEIVLTNVSNRDLAMNSDTRGFDFHIKVRDSKRTLAAGTRLGYVWNGNAPVVDPAKVSPQDLESSAVHGTLKAGATFTRQLNAAKLYQMHSPGRYTIQVLRLDPGNPGAVVKSNVIVVTVRN